jgi:hypothetical protein
MYHHNVNIFNVFICYSHLFYLSHAWTLIDVIRICDEIYASSQERLFDGKIIVAIFVLIRFLSILFLAIILFRFALSKLSGNMLQRNSSEKFDNIHKNPLHREYKYCIKEKPCFFNPLILKFMYDKINGMLLVSPHAFHSVTATFVCWKTFNMLISLVNRINRAIT